MNTNPLVAYTNVTPQWMRKIQYELDTAEWMLSDTQECPALTMDMAFDIMLRKAGR